MTTSDTQTMEIPTNFLELIESYNHYKRLGFNTTQVELDAIHAAWSLKCVAFEQARVDNLITAEECQRGLQLIEAAYKTLVDESARRKYDKELFRAQKKSKVVAVKPAEAAATAGTQLDARVAQAGAATARSTTTVARHQVRNAPALPALRPTRCSWPRP